MANITVKSGDTLSQIAQTAGIGLSQLLQLNPQFQANPNLIFPGQQVNLPDIGVNQPATQQQQGLVGIQQGVQQAQQTFQGIQQQATQLTQQPTQLPFAGSVTGQAPTGEFGGIQGLSPDIQQLLQFLNPPETEQQIQFREQQQATLDRLISLQEQLATAGQPSEELEGIRTAIAEQQRVLQELTPRGLLETQPALQAEGITQGALRRKVAALRDPIASTLSDLLFSESLLAQQDVRRTQQLQAQAKFAGQEFELREAIQGLQPQPFELPGGIQSEILKRAFFPEEPEVGPGQLREEIIGGFRVLRDETGKVVSTQKVKQDDIAAEEDLGFTDNQLRKLRAFGIDALDIEAADTLIFQGEQELKKLLQQREKGLSPGFIGGTADAFFKVWQDAKGFFGF